MKVLKVAIESSVKNNLPLLLVGKHGTGKSYSITQEAKKQKKTLHRVIITQETTPEDLVCQYELKENETIMIKHELLKAVEKGDWVCLEEINMGSPAVLTLLNGLLETDPQSRFIRFQDLEVKPHKNFRLFATANPTEYTGTNRMNDALLSRFLVQKVEPDYKAFLSIIGKKYSTQTREKALKFLSGIMKIEKHYEIYTSPRELLVYAQLIESGLSEKEAMGMIMGRHYDLEDSTITDILAILEVERDRDEIHIINTVELEKMVDEKTREVKDKIDQLKIELDAAKHYKEKYEEIQKLLTATKS
jgi:MoxR-like ATPase